MKNELINELANTLLCHGMPPEYVSQVTCDMTIILSNYKIDKNTAEIVPYQGNINEEMLKRFLIAKRVSGRAERTLKYYRDTIRHALLMMQKSCLEITADDIRLYLAKREIEDGLSKTTLNNELRNMKSFFRWMQNEEIRATNPTAKIDPIKQPKRKKPAYTEMEIEKIRSACQCAREKCIIEMLLSTGCRVSELVNIKIEEIKGDHLIVHGKGNKERTVYLNAKAQFAIQNYLAERSDSNPYLFPACAYNVSEFGEAKKIYYNGDARKMPEWYRHPDLVHKSMHQDLSSIESVVRKIGKRAGVEKVHPHRFRRTCATFALRRGMPIEQVSMMLGHESIDTTQIYLDISDEDLELSHKKYVT